jgi:hypothetical protein
MVGCLMAWRRVIEEVLNLRPLTPDASSSDSTRLSQREARDRASRYPMKTWRSSKMRKYSKFIVVAGALTALAVPSAAMAGRNSDAAHTCQQGGWQTLARQDATSFANQGDCVTYAANGGTYKVLEPQFGIHTDSQGPYTIVPFTPHVKTYLYGVHGYDQNVPITHDVTVRPADCGGQFWIGYEPDAGWVAANHGTWHIDFNA